MFQLVKNYISKLTKEDIKNIGLKNGITLDDEEIDFLYRFIKKNYEALYANPNIDLSKYKMYFKDDHFERIMDIIKAYKLKYSKYIN